MDEEFSNEKSRVRFDARENRLRSFREYINVTLDRIVTIPDSREVERSQKDFIIKELRELQRRISDFVEELRF